MKQRKWDSKTKTLDSTRKGLSGRQVSEICNEYGIHKNQYYSLRNKFFKEFPGGVRGHGLKLMSDNGSQPTSRSLMKACSNLEVG